MSLYLNNGVLNLSLNENKGKNVSVSLRTIRMNADDLVDISMSQTNTPQLFV